MNYRLSSHAEKELKRRDIPLELVEKVLKYPDQIVEERKGRKAYQSKLDFGEGKVFLLRAVVNDNIDPIIVITLYRTSKIKKYWRSDEDNI